MQWIVRLADARVDYSVLALVRRTFRAERVSGTGLSFSVRNKLEAGEAKNADLSVLPPIPGFADPPLRSPKTQGAKAPGNPWRIEVRNIRVEHFDDIWFDAYHYRGTARLDGAFFLRPGLMVWIGPARVGIESGEVRIGRAPVGVSVSGSIDGTFEPFEPPKVHGSEVWQKTFGSRQARRPLRPARVARAPRLSGRHAPRRGSGQGNDSGLPSSTELRKASSASRFTTGRCAWTSSGSGATSTCACSFPRGISRPVPSRSLAAGLAFSNVRASGSDDSRRWWGRFDIRSGKIGSTTTARIDAETRDARPLLALLAADLPAWTRDLLNLDTFSATGTVSLGRH